jgi:hypothetical protein
MAARKNLQEEAPEKGSATEFVIKFLKSTSSITLEEAKKHFVKSWDFTCSQRALDRYKTIKWDKPFKYREDTKPNGNVVISMTYSNAKTRLQNHVTIVKKINGKWMFTGPEN